MHSQVCRNWFLWKKEIQDISLDPAPQDLITPGSRPLAPPPNESEDPQSNPSHLISKSQMYRGSTDANFLCFGHDLYKRPGDLIKEAPDGGGWGRFQKVQRGMKGGEGKGRREKRRRANDEEEKRKKKRKPGAG